MHKVMASGHSSKRSHRVFFFFLFCPAALMLKKFYSVTSFALGRCKRGNSFHSSTKRDLGRTSTSDC